MGKWWGNLKLGKRCEAREIDIVVETEKALYLGDCKWTEQKIGEKELNRLKESSEALPTKKSLRYMLISKSGFKISETPEILLFDAEKIAKQKQKGPLNPTQPSRVGLSRLNRKDHETRNRYAFSFVHFCQGDL